MATYIYNCENCGSFEMQQPMTDDALTTCPECGGEVYRVIQRVAVRFVGPGFTKSGITKSGRALSSSEVISPGYYTGDGDEEPPVVIDRNTETVTPISEREHHRRLRRQRPLPRS